MPARLNKVLDHLHQTLAAPGGEADGRLLGRFVATRDEAAIKALREARNSAARSRAAEVLLSAARQLADRPESVVRPAPPAGARPSEPKTYSFQAGDKPWAQVFEWLTDQTGKPLVTAHKPTGTFTFVGPPGRKYTMAEIIDVLNEALLDQKFLLVRRPNSFTLLPADENVGWADLPEVSPPSWRGGAGRSWSGWCCR